MRSAIVIFLCLFACVAFGAPTQPQEDVTDSIAIASLLTLFALGFNAGSH